MIICLRQDIQNYNNLDPLLNELESLSKTSPDTSSQARVNKIYGQIAAVPILGVGWNFCVRSPFGSLVKPRKIERAKKIFSDLKGAGYKLGFFSNLLSKESFRISSFGVGAAFLLNQIPSNATPESRLVFSAILAGACFAMVFYNQAPKNSH